MKADFHQKNSLTKNINIPGYIIEHNPTGASAGGALMFIAQNCNIKYEKTYRYTVPKN